MSNPLAFIAETYNEYVEEANNKGYDKLFKMACDYIIDFINNATTIYRHKVKFTVTDVEYLDGYFIFGMGSNSVLHFHIKECPGWKFGIWWDQPEDNRDYILGTFFAQYEKDIDKFKPTASIINDKLRIDFDFTSEEVTIAETTHCYNSKFLSSIEFIHKHPLRAWGRDQCYYDYNTEVISNFEIARRFIRHKWIQDKEEFVKKHFNNIMYKWVEKKVLPCIEGEPFIYDYGDRAFPRYEIVSYLPDDTPEDELGYFTDPDLREYIHKKQERLSNIASKLLNTYWSKCFAYGTTYITHEQEEQF